MGNDGTAREHWHLHRPIFRPRYAAKLTPRFGQSPITFWRWTITFRVLRANLAVVEFATFTKNGVVYSADQIKRVHGSLGSAKMGARPTTAMGNWVFRGTLESSNP